MKIVQSGTLYFAGGTSHLNGWIFDAEGSKADREALSRQALELTLRHIAQCHGFAFSAAPADPFEAISLDAERESARLIANVRWKA